MSTSPRSFPGSMVEADRLYYSRTGRKIECDLLGESDRQEAGESVLRRRIHDATRVTFALSGRS